MIKRGKLSCLIISFYFQLQKYYRKCVNEMCKQRKYPAKNKFLNPIEILGRKQLIIDPQLTTFNQLNTCKIYVAIIKYSFCVVSVAKKLISCFPLAFLNNLALENMWSWKLFFISCQFCYLSQI